MTTGGNSLRGLVLSDEPHHAKVQYKEVAPVQQYLAAFEKLHAADKSGERYKKLFGTVGGVGIVVTFLSFFFAIPSESPLLLGAAGLLLVLTVSSFLLRAMLGGSDVDDRKLHAAQRPLQVLAPEIKDARRVAVWIDFGAYDRTKPVSDATGKLFDKSGQRVFKKPEWLRLRFSLLDGTAVRLSASTTVKRKQKQKRKYLKLKDKITDELLVQIKAPSGKQLSTADAEALRARFQSRSGLTLTGCRIKPRVAELKFRTGVGLRTRARYGWEGRQLQHLLDGDKILEAVIYAYNATAVAAAPRAA